MEDKFFRFKPELKSLFGRVVAGAECLYYVSAWFRPRIEARYPGLTRDSSLLPNFIAPSTPPDRVEPAAARLVTVMDLHVHRRKGLPDLLAALALARQARPELTLDVIGWSSPGVQAKVDALVERHGVRTAVRFLGTLANAEVIGRLPGYAGFVLAARNETFGMSYVEALMAGVPILYTKGSGIDGYLHGLDVGIGVPQGDVPALAAGMRALLEQAPVLRAEIRRSHAALCDRFGPDRYLIHYRGLVSRLARRPAARMAELEAAE